MKPIRWLGLAAIVGLGGGIPACAGTTPPPRSVDAKRVGDAEHRRALEAEARGDDDAVSAALDLVDAGLAGGPNGLPAVLAGLDALVWRDTLGLSRIAALHALAFRVPGAFETAERRLTASWQAGHGHPLARAYVAEAALDLARFRGDAAGVALWRPRTGAALHATGLGPLASSPLTAVEKPTPLEVPGAPLGGAYEGVAPFATQIRPLVLEADDGVLDAGSLSVQPGLHLLVVDVDVPSPQRVHFALRTTSTAVMTVGGATVLARPYALGGAPAVRFGAADLPAGKARIVVRLGLNDDGGRVALVVVGEDGAGLATSAPAVGSSAKGVPTRALALEIDAERDVAAAALLAMGDARGARRLLEPASAKADASADTILLYARALGRSDDVPEIRRMERVRAAYERVLTTWPASPEAVIGRAIYAAGRRGPGEGRVETLRDLAKRRAENAPASPLVHAFEAATAAELGMRDVALTGWDAVKAPLAGTPLLAELDDKAHPRTGKEAEAFACAAPLVDRQTPACFLWRSRRGDSVAAYAELDRLRALRSSPSALRREEIGQRISDGEVDKALALYDALPPADRMLSWLGVVPRARAKEALARIDVNARDAPASLAPLARLFLPDTTKELDARGAKAVEAGRAAPADASATLVLLHDESYVIAPSGLLSVLVHDVRRVAGTTDVDQGAGGTTFLITGREMRRTLRRRVHKKDGRVLEPDRAAFASQGNADLSQLEPGDCIEQVVEADALPDHAGQLVVDTPDLLPERTSVRRGTVTLSYPRGLPLARWSHALLGKPMESDKGAQHIVRWELVDAPPRRLEEGVPRMDRDVSASFGTYRWTDVARLVGDQVRALADRDPWVTKWAHEAGGAGATISRATVERVVAAAGKTVRVANGAILSDMAAAMSSGAQQATARQILELGQGSRSWLIYRAFGELGIPAELVLAEHEPFSADPSFPPRPGRFEHPLVVARLADGDVWIDADIAGPPLPAGRVSPELRGRTALKANGEMIPVVVAGMDDARDEVDVALTVDDRGDAKGTFSVVLRGRQAQGLADALETVVGTDRREMLRRVVLGWLPWATVNEVALSSREGAWEISLRAEVAIPAFAQGEGKRWVLPGLEPLHFVFPRSSASTLGATFATRGARKSALAIDSAFQYRVHRRIELPASMKPPAALPSVRVSRPGLEATRTAKAEGRVIDESFTLSLATGTVSTESYDAFAADAKKVDDGFLAGTKIGR